MNKESKTVKYHARWGYKDKTAEDYDRKRSKRKKWKREMAAIQTLASEFEPGASVLDIPLGTGRFLPLYSAGGHAVYGIDISGDMLRQAVEKKSSHHNNVYMVMGEAEHIPLPDNSIDYAVCIRLLNWVTKPVFNEVVKELLRVARKGIILGYRSEVPMTPWDFIRMGAVSILPTPRHIARWAKGWIRFYRRVKGKIKSMVIKKNGENRNKSGNKQKVFRGSTYYDPAKAGAFFEQLGLITNRQFPIDTLPAFLKYKKRPYSIYELKLQKNEVPSN